jgi:hypothetical protein
VEKTTHIQNHHRGAPYSRVVVAPSIYIYYIYIYILHTHIYYIHTYLYSHTFILSSSYAAVRPLAVYACTYLSTICPFSSSFPIVFQAYEKLHHYGDKRYHTVHCFGARLCHRVWQVLGKYKSEYTRFQYS